MYLWFCLFLKFSQAFRNALNRLVSFFLFLFSLKTVLVSKYCIVNYITSQNKISCHFSRQKLKVKKKCFTGVSERHGIAFIIHFCLFIFCPPSMLTYSTSCFEQIFLFAEYLQTLPYPLFFSSFFFCISASLSLCLSVSLPLCLSTFLCLSSLLSAWKMLFSFFALKRLRYCECVIFVRRIWYLQSVHNNNNKKGLFDLVEACYLRTLWMQSLFQSFEFNWDGFQFFWYLVFSWITI